MIIRTPISKLLVLVLSLLISSCASSYKPLSPDTVSFKNGNSNDGIEVAYKYNILAERGNKKYAKKEAKKDVKLIAVKITNNTDHDISSADNLEFYAGDFALNLLDPLMTQKILKQHVAGYLPYLLLSFTRLTITVNSPTVYSEEHYPIGLIIGPGIMLGNMLAAANANNKMHEELKAFDIRNILIKKGESAYGIIAVRGMDYDPITARIKK